MLLRRPFFDYFFGADSKKYRRKLNLIAFYGQSLDTGYNASPALTTTAPAGTQNYKFVGGIVSPATLTSLVPLISAVETIPGPGGPYTGGETPLVKCGNVLAQTYGQRFLMVSAAVPGTSAQARAKGSSYYTALMSYITAAKARADELGYELIVRAICVDGGEADSYGSNYYTYNQSIQSDFETDSKAITGQTENVPMFLADSAGFAGGLIDANTNAIDLAIDFPTKFYLVGSKTILSYADSLHIDNNGAVNLGAMYAKAIGKVIFENTSFNTVYPIATVRASNIVTVTFHVQSGSLQSDIVTVTDPTGGNLGFTWYDSTLSATVASVAIINATQVRVTLSGVPTGSNKYIGYARDLPVANPGPTTGARGNLVDADGNWCYRFQRAAT